ncbi:hypothetical protein Tco_1472034, partial [Tanacetum coccineum]
VMSKRARSTSAQASSSREEIMEEKVRKFRLFDYEYHQMNYDNLAGCFIHPGDVVDWEFLSNKGITRYTKGFTFSIGDDRFNVGNTKAKSIRDPRIKLAHWCITITITGRKETTNRVTEIDLFYLYCIFGEGVVCNIPYWLAKYLNGPPPHIYRKKSLVKMGVIMELHEGECCCPATRGDVEENEGDDEEGDGEGGNEGVGGFVDIYQNISIGDWQIDPFPRFKANYTPYGYQGHMPPVDPNE